MTHCANFYSNLYPPLRGADGCERRRKVKRQVGDSMKKVSTIEFRGFSLTRSLLRLRSLREFN